MAKFPRIEKSIFTINAPSDGREIRYRAFTVKEEKILLIAQQASRDLVARAQNEEVPQRDILAAAKGQMMASIQVVNNCLLGEVEAADLPTIDFEYLMVAIRSRAVGSGIEFKIDGKPDEDGKPSKKSVLVDIDLDMIKVVRDESHSNKIAISDDMTLIMRYPTMMHTVKRLESSGDKTMNSIVQFETMRDCLKSIVQGEDVYDFDDQTPEEVNEWVDDLDDENVAKINKFFETAPFLRYEFPYADPDTNEEKTLVIQGFDSFFI